MTVVWLPFSIALGADDEEQAVLPVKLQLCGHAASCADCLTGWVLPKVRHAMRRNILQDHLWRAVCVRSGRGLLDMYDDLFPVDTFIRLAPRFEIYCDACSYLYAMLISRVSHPDHSGHVFPMVEMPCRGLPVRAGSSRRGPRFVDAPSRRPV